MAAGYQTAKADVNNRAGNVAIHLRDAIQDAANFKAWLDTQLDADLIALGFVQADVNTLRSAMSDLAQLQQIYIGAINLATAKDFRTFAKLLAGVI